MRMVREPALPNWPSLVQKTDVIEKPRTMQQEQQNITKRSRAVLLKAITLYLLIAGSLFSGHDASAQRIAPVGTWTPYVSHNKARSIIRQGDRLYVRSEGGMYWYDMVTGDYRAYSPVEGLTGVSPSAFFLDTLTGVFFLGYDDGSVDYFTNPDQGFSYITDIRRTELFTNKRINDFEAHNGLLYIATEFGIVIFDIEKREVRSSVTKIGGVSTGRGVKAIEIVQDTLWAAMGDDGLWQVDVNLPNITVPQVWLRSEGRLDLSYGPAKLLGHLGDRVYVYIGDTVFEKNPGQLWDRAPFPISLFTNMGNSGSKFYWLSYFNDLRVFMEQKPLLPYQTNLNHDARITSAYLIDTTEYYLGDTVRGLMRWYARDSFEILTPPGPFNNQITQLSVGNGQLFIAPGGRSGSGPAGNFDGFYSFNLQDGWNRFNVDDELSRDSVYGEFARIHYDARTGKAYAGSWNYGVVRVEYGNVTGAWTSTNSNLSPSFNQGIGPNTRVSGLATDDQGNLWATAILADYNLNVLNTNDEWININLSRTSPVDIMVDDYGNKWINGNGAGITVFNENGTLENTSDDQVKYLTSDPGNGGLPNNSVYAITADRRGQIWLGTLEGVAVFANPGNVFSSNFPDASCPVIEGFCLLRDQRVSSIAVDGANRKWIGTNNGVYLVNPQGNRLLEHYTTENSPIFSDEIRDIRIDPGTGEVFIGTSKGLISLMGDATGGKEDSDSMYVFPNPIPYDYDGTVAITSTVTDAQVRITNVAGQLVRQLDALGGQAVWDFRDVAGQRLAPGIYLAMVADSDGKLAGASRFVVLEREY
jgi:hypothetical protein